MKSLNITIATGGTGGHIYPAIALADALKERGHRVSFIGNGEKMEATIVPKANFEFYPIQNRGLVGNPIQKFFAIVAQIAPTFKSMSLLSKIQSNRVVVFGGYVSIPVGLAAAIKGIPLFLHEQNSIPGLANRILQPFAKAIAVSYPHSVQDFTSSKTKFIGNPRGALYKKQDNRDGFFKLHGLSTSKKTAMIVMGSQGSETVNEILKEVVLEMHDQEFQMIVVTGANHYDDFLLKEYSAENVAIVSTINQLEALSYIDLMVCRAGATTVSEVIAAQVPAIFIPSPYVVKNHQLKNVEPLIEQQAALLLLEKDLSKDSLLAKIKEVFNNESLHASLQKNMLEFQTPNALTDFLEMIEKEYE